MSARPDPATLAATIGAIVVLSLAGTAHAAPSPMASQGGTWQLVANLSDEFNGDAVDTGKWNAYTPPWANWDWDAKNATESGGGLHLTMRHEDRGSHGSYSSGFVRSKQTILYGYFEARIKAAKRFPGTASAFWAAPENKDGGRHTEIDFVETSQHPRNARQIDTNTHVFSLPDEVVAAPMPIHNRMSWIADWYPWDDYHVYGCEWSAKTIVWYVDGQEVGHLENAFWHQPLNVTLSLGLRQPLRTLDSGSGFPTTMDVDYVRVWQHPEAGKH